MITRGMRDFSVVLMSGSWFSFDVTMRLRDTGPIVSPQFSRSYHG